MRAGERGFTFPIMLLWVALASLSLATIGPLWADAAQRERERDLLRIGEIYAHAISRYREVSPGAAKIYPQRLEELLHDTRFVGTVRHLRRLYADPTNPSSAWALITDDQGRIIGVRSQNNSQPMLENPTTPRGRRLENSKAYAQWHFTAAWYLRPLPTKGNNAATADSQATGANRQ